MCYQIVVMYFRDSFGLSSFDLAIVVLLSGLESNHVRDAGAEPGMTAGGADARKLP